MLSPAEKLKSLTSSFLKAQGGVHSRSMGGSHTQARVSCSLCNKIGSCARSSLQAFAQIRGSLTYCYRARRSHQDLSLMIRRSIIFVFSHSKKKGALTERGIVTAQPRASLWLGAPSHKNFTRALHRRKISLPRKQSDLTLALNHLSHLYLDRKSNSLKRSHITKKSNSPFRSGMPQTLDLKEKHHLHSPCSRFARFCRARSCTCKKTNCSLVSRSVAVAYRSLALLLHTDAGEE